MKKNLPTWQQVKNENFTKKKQNLMDKKLEARFILRRIKEIRREKQITQQELARRAGLPRSTISKIESGYQNTSINKLRQLVNAMEMDLDIQLVPINTNGQIKRTR